VANIFIVVLGMLYNSNFRFYLRSSRCSEGSADSLPSVTLMNGHNIRPTSCLPSDRFWVSSETSCAVVPRMYGTHCKHNPLFHHQFSITILTHSYMDACGLELTPVHILKYIGRMSNNNKMLINNSLCYFTIRVVYI